MSEDTPVDVNSLPPITNEVTTPLVNEETPDNGRGVDNANSESPGQEKPKDVATSNVNAIKKNQVFAEDATNVDEVEANDEEKPKVLPGLHKFVEDEHIKEEINIKSEFDDFVIPVDGPNVTLRPPSVQTEGTSVPRYYLIALTFPLLIDSLLTSLLIGAYFLTKGGLQGFAKALDFEAHDTVYLCLASFAFISAVVALGILPKFKPNLNRRLLLAGYILYLLSKYLLSILVIIELDMLDARLAYAWTLLLLNSIEIVLVMSLVCLFAKTTFHPLASAIISNGVIICTDLMFYFASRAQLLTPVAVVAVVIIATMLSFYINFDFMFIATYRENAYKLFEQTRVVGDLWTDVFGKFFRDLFGNMSRKKSAVKIIN